MLIPFPRDLIAHPGLAAQRLLAVAACCVAVPLIAAGWFSVEAQVPSAPAGHRQPSAADVAKETPEKKTAASPANGAMERALSNVCRGCSQAVPVGNVPHYNVALACGAPPPAGQEDNCRRDEAEARDKVTAQWAQFPTVARSNCIQTAAIGGRPSYVQLFICLKARQIAPTLPDAQQ
jgi:hypothetical protein